MRKSEPEGQSMRPRPACELQESSHGLHGSHTGSRSPRKTVAAEGEVWLNAVHHVVEAGKVHGLLAVAPRLVWIGMDLDQQAIGAGGNGDAGKCRNKLAMARRMAGVGDDGEVRDLLEQRNGGHIECVARCRFKGADAALAENDVRVAVVQDQL